MAEKTKAEQDRENAQKAKAKDEADENDVVLPRPGDESVPEDEREYPIGELEARKEAAEAHERLHNQMLKDEAAVEARRENIEQGPELADKARDELEEAQQNQLTEKERSAGIAKKARGREKEDDAQREAHGDSIAQRQATGQRQVTKKS